MKSKKILLLMSVTMLLLVQTTIVFAAVPVYMDGEALAEVLATDVRQNSLFAPIRPIAEKMGATVHYDGRQISITYEGVVIKLTLGDKEAVVQNADGTTASYRLSAAPYLKNNRTMLPLRFVSEQLGCLVSYEGMCVKLILPGAEIGGQPAYTMTRGNSGVTGHKHIVNNCIALLEECKGQAIGKPIDIYYLSEYKFYNRQAELLADWRFWSAEQQPPYATLYLQNALTGQYYEVDESVYDYYFADDGGQLELEMAIFMGAKGSDFDWRTLDCLNAVGIYRPTDLR